MGARKNGSREGDTLIQHKTKSLVKLMHQTIAHFTVAGENEGGVDLVLIQPFLLYYVNHVFLMLTSIFLAKFTL